MEQDGREGGRKEGNTNTPALPYESPSFLQPDLVRRDPESQYPEEWLNRKSCERLGFIKEKEGKK